ncbi:MAG: PQQ-binding-like beta-propeller repeat protein [Gemmatimonadales bacterium]
MRARRRWFLVLFVAMAGAIVLVRGLRWRAQLVGLKLLGEIPDLSWMEMARLSRPGSPVYLEPMVRNHNPHLTILVADLSRSALAVGQARYQQHCAACHGESGEGAMAPALAGRSLSHGNSDWALYRAIARGIPGTGMPKADLSEGDRWKVVAYVKALRAGTAKGKAPTDRHLNRFTEVGPARLVAAGENPADWLTYSGRYDGWRYSALRQIDTANIGRLRVLWMYQMPGSDPKVETTPLVVNGLMFLTTPSDGIRALDAETGSLLWSYDRALPDGLKACCGSVNRGLAVLGSTLYLATLDAHLVALDARTGTVRWDIKAADPDSGYSFTSAPLAVADLIVIGSAGGEYPTRGFIDAYDAATGARRWRFYTTPGSGAPGNETWEGSSWQTGGAPPWLTGSYDARAGLLYWGVGNPNPDFNGDDRSGDNLHSNSVVALEAATGKLRWHFQFTPHDEHDWDAAQIPVLLDPATGSPQHLLLWANRNGFCYVLDRSTGRFLRATGFARQNWAKGIDSLGRPIIRTDARPSRAGTLTYPSHEGATNWWSPSYSPQTGLFYVPTLERGELFFRGETKARPGQLRLGGGHLIEPAAATGILVRALHPADGSLAWENRLADASEPYPAVGGLLSTGGGVLFGGGGQNVVGLDDRTGQLLWRFRAGGDIWAAPISYLAGGRQQVTVAAGRAILTFGIE